MNNQLNLSDKIGIIAFKKVQTLARIKMTQTDVSLI